MQGSGLFYLLEKGGLLIVMYKFNINFLNNIFYNLKDL